MIDYKEFVSVLFAESNLPPPVEIPADLKPYWDALKSKEAGKAAAKEAAA